MYTRRSRRNFTFYTHSRNIFSGLLLPCDGHEVVLCALFFVYFVFCVDRCSRMGSLFVAIASICLVKSAQGEILQESLLYLLGNERGNCDTERRNFLKIFGGAVAGKQPETGGVCFKLITHTTPTRAECYGCRKCTQLRVEYPGEMAR